MSLSYTEELIYAVAAQIYRDIENEDYTAIFELLENLDAEKLEYYLPEEVADSLAEKWKLGVDTPAQ